MKLKIEIEIADDKDCIETAEILRDLADTIEEKALDRSHNGTLIRDGKGKMVGIWRVEA